MNINNLYNFKNPIKHFLDIGKVQLPPNISSLPIEDFCWVEPFNFRVKKQDDKYRTLKMPNILNFIRAIEHFKDMPYFYDIKSIDTIHKRLSANIKTGDFAIGEYDKKLEVDFEKLCIYDCLLKLDIKEYYGRIYTHKINLNGYNERFLSSMNLGATNGLIMGNYLSLYFAEVYLNDICNDIVAAISNLNIDCEFSYFSDDFYFFCNKNDIENVTKIFDKALEKYELERNDGKKEIWNYETFNNYNLVERYWKKIIAHSNVRVRNEGNNNKLYFINQILYRMSNLEDEKLKKVFINSFFKTRYFYELDLEKYLVKDYDYHQLCFLFKFSPEAMLYTVDKFRSMSKFDKCKLYKFFKVRYKEVFKAPFNEEQLYFYYAIKLFEFTDILEERIDDVLNSDNQILISYYLKDKLFRSEDINKLKEYDDEKYWFQNYHLILYTQDLLNDIEQSIDKYLIPHYAGRDRQKNSYKNFYKDNLESGTSIIRDVEDVRIEIEDYLLVRMEESEASYASDEVDVSDLFD